MAWVGTLLFLAVLCAGAYALGVALNPRHERARYRLLHPRAARRAEQPTARPIQAIAADLHRLGRRFHTLEPHASYTKVQAVCAAYDRALGECCATLGVAHLLGVLPPGAELDAERRRVEAALTDSGVRLPRAAA